MLCCCISSILVLTLAYNYEKQFHNAEMCTKQDTYEIQKIWTIIIGEDGTDDGEMDVRGVTEG